MPLGQVHPFAPATYGRGRGAPVPQNQASGKRAPKAITEPSFQAHMARILLAGGSSGNCILLKT